jgi:hypothetical protein
MRAPGRKGGDASIILPEISDGEKIGFVRFFFPW